MQFPRIRPLGLAALLVLSALQTGCPPPWAFRDGRIERRGDGDRRGDHRGDRWDDRRDDGDRDDHDDHNGRGGYHGHNEGREH